MRRTNVAAIALALTCGCVPAVTHAPRVEPGPSMELSAGVAGIPATRGTPGYSGFVPSPATIGGAYGWRNDSLDVGLRVGGGVNFIFALDLDAYLQLPRRALLGLDGGIGVGAVIPSIASTAPMPYLELGLVRSGRGPFAVVGYVHQSIDTSKVEGPEIRHDDGLSATVACQFSDGRTRVRPYASALVGHRYPMQCMGKFSDCSAYARPFTMFIGLSLERVLRR
jgi:hypothetical protein